MNEIKNCFLVTIKLLKNSLNKIHNTNYPLGFWLILIGPWLLKFIDYTYYRFSEIENLKKYYSDDSIDKACLRALHYGISSYSKIKRILESNCHDLPLNGLNAGGANAKFN